MSRTLTAGLAAGALLSGAADAQQFVPHPYTPSSAYVPNYGMHAPVWHGRPVSHMAAGPYAAPWCPPMAPSRGAAPGAVMPQPSGAPRAPGAPGAAQQAPQPGAAQDALTQTPQEQADLDATISSATGAAAAPQSVSPNIVGDFIFPGGQFAYTPPQVLVPTQIFRQGLRFSPFPTSPNNFPSDTFFDPNDPTVSFTVDSPGLLTGNPGTVNSWTVTGSPGSSVDGEPGTAFLTAIDSFDGTYVVTVAQPSFAYAQPPTVFIDLPSLAINRLKVTENNHPLPQDRVFFNYNRYQNALQTAGPAGARLGLDVNQFTFGVERTFGGGLGSVQLNVPFASMLDSDQFLNQGAGAESVQMGNVGVILKLLLWQSCQTAVAAGLGISTPTADDVQIFETAQSVDPLLRIRNESVHLTPYLTALVRPWCSRWALQLWGQVDFDTRGNGIETNINGFRSRGELRDQALLYLDTALAYDLWDSGCCPGRFGLTRISPAIESHYTSTLESARYFQQGSVVVGNLRDQLDILNLTMATHFVFGSRGHITPAYIVPLSNQSNRVFDSELALQVQWNY